MSEVHSLLEKLRKLKALEEGARSVGSMDEAANAAEKFQSLLLKHNLSEDQVKEHSIKEKVQMLDAEFDPEPFRLVNSVSWVERLVKHVAHSSMCHCLYQPHTGTYRILGEKNNVGAVLYMVEQLFYQVNMALAVSWKNYRGFEKRGAYSRGFILGCVDAIVVRLAAVEKKMIGENKEMGLMVISKRELATRFMRDKYQVKMVRAAGVTNRSNDGYDHGQRAGKNMDLDRNGGRTGQKRLGN